jgi:prepilin-type processing-associated H-X9-DG protein
LFPVFAQAREKARQASCASNLKQIGLAITQYVQDNDETFPINVYTNPTNNNFAVTWREAVTPYIKNGNGAMQNATPSNQFADNTRAIGGVWRCPDAPGIKAYQPNEELIGAVNFGNPNSATLAQITRPADMGLVFETGVDPSASAANGGPQAYDFMAVDAGAYCIPPYVTPPAGNDALMTGTPEDADDSTGGAIFPRYRHQDSMNTLYTDGHVKAVRKGQLNWCKNIAEPGLAFGWGSGNENSYFDPNNGTCKNDI